MSNMFFWYSRFHLFDMNQLKQSEAKNQDLEYKLKNAAEDFFQERAHRDSTEHNLKNKLRVSPLLKK